MAATISKKKIILFIVSIVLAVGIAFIPTPEVMHPLGMRFVAIFMWLILLMTFKIFEEYLSVLFMLTALLAFRIAEPSYIFSQFTSATFWQILTILALAAAVRKTTVLTRLALYFLKPFPPTYAGQIAALMLSGLFLSLLIPSIYAKILILAPIALTICDTAGYEKSSKPATGMFLALFVTAYFLSNGFTTGNLNVQLSQAFIGFPMDFFEWLIAASVWTTVMSIGTYAIIMLIYRPKNAPPMHKDYIKHMMDNLPPIGRNDKFAAVIMGISLILWMSEGITGISALMTNLLAVVAFAGVGVMTPEDFNNHVDWKLLIVIGGILSAAAFFVPFGITTWLANTFRPILAPLTINPWIFVPSLVLVVMIAKYVLVTQIGNIAIFSAVFLPLVVPLGYHPFIVVQIANMANDFWSTSYNNVMIKPAYNITQNRLVVYRDVQPMAYMLMVVMMIAFTLSIPLWRHIGFFDWWPGYYY